MSTIDKLRAARIEAAKARLIVERALAAIKVG